MWKKMIAALAAAAMLCCTLVTPAAAAETYKKGDVNMDGRIDLADAMLVLREATIFIVGSEVCFSEEQMQLASISGRTLSISFKAGDKTIPFTVGDAQIILMYYTEYTLGHLPVSEDIVEYWREDLIQRT